MKAVQINSYGGVEVLEVKSDVAKPSAGEGQVIVEVFAASINPFDWKVREGLTKDYLKLDFPVLMGGDFAGKVSAIGDGVSDFKVGDEVFGQAAAYGGGSGAFAEFAVANADKIALKPKNLDFLESASLPLVALSALQALETHIGLKPGPASVETSTSTKVSVDKSAGKQKILIIGGAGGIGSMAIQIAKALGAYVATTVSSRDVDYAKSLGADEVIDFKTQNFEEILSGFDAVFDTAGGEVTDKSFKVLKKGGILVTMAGMPSDELAKEAGVTVFRQFTNGNSEMLSKIAKMVEEGKLKPQVDKVFELDQIKEAFTHQETGHPRGKVVLKIKD